MSRPLPGNYSVGLVREIHFAAKSKLEAGKVLLQGELN